MTLEVGYNIYQLSTYKFITNVQQVVVLEIYILVLCDWTDRINTWTTPAGNVLVYQQFEVRDPTV